MPRQIKVQDRQARITAATDLDRRHGGR